MRTNSLDIKQIEVDGQGASGGSNPNLLINGNFDIWQRGTTYDYSVQSTRYDTADRWMMRSTASSDVTISRQIFTVGQTVVPGNPTYFLRWDITSYTAAFGKLQQRIENVRVVSGQDVTVSFWAKADSACDITVSMLQDFGTSGSSDVETTPVAKTLSTSWQKFTETITVPSVSGKTISGGDDFLAVGFGMPQAARTVDFAQVKVEIGSVATPFQPRSIGEELALCQRYYELLPFQGNPLVSYTGQYGYCQFDFKVTKRAAPTRTLSGFQFYLNNVGWYSPNGSVTFGGGADSSLVSVIDTRLVSGVSYIVTGWVISDAEL
jgi:hypothetical protein